MRAFALVPLSVGGRVLGALAVNFARPGRLREGDRELLELFAAHTAAALERARLRSAERQPPSGPWRRGRRKRPPCASWTA